jgi:hypothetical protein
MRGTAEKDVIVSEFEGGDSFAFASLYPWDGFRAFKQNTCILGAKKIFGVHLLCGSLIVIVLSMFW